MPTYKSSCVEQTEKIGAEFAAALSGGDVVAFFGGLGMGKTAFVRGIAIGMGINAHVSSPTFALVHDYGGSPTFYHFDMYRVNSWDSLYSTGFFDYLNNKNILAVEWSENIENALPDKHYRVEIKRGESEDDRIIKITKEGANNENSCG
ncbi:MAG TPA: tRNA (adenosine(37)-N6)-threonylcarbamoyltransferase complex ATPase subunit type 1 TsaE [Clostridia bacterium]|nr:tRNA (adenosine(37)-N6)-threonylcarbamoyltransferase complex ATPase subunit type 1 TsaE [Clostridia bacterium]